MQPASPKAKYAASARKGPRAFGHTCFVLSRAKPSNVTSPSGMPAARTHLKRGVGDTDDNVCNWVQLPGVNVFLVLHGWDAKSLTDATIAPSLNALSSPISIDPLIIGVYVSSNPSSSRSDKRRASSYVKSLAAGMGSGKGTNGVICREL